jgi:hypothetical protein
MRNEIEEENIVKKIMIALIGLLMMGCATTTRQDMLDQLSTFKGKTKHEVLLKWGTPNEIRKDGKADLYVYNHSYSNSTPGYSYNTSQNNIDARGNINYNQVNVNAANNSTSQNLYVPPETQYSTSQLLIWIENDIVTDISCNEK